MSGLCSVFKGNEALCSKQQAIWKLEFGAGGRAPCDIRNYGDLCPERLENLKVCPSHASPVAKELLTEQFAVFFRCITLSYRDEGCIISIIEICSMESQASSQSNALPNIPLPRPPLPWPMAYQQQHPFCAHPIPYFSGPSAHGCYSQHWVYPHCIHAHASNLAPPTCHRCPNILASPCNLSSIASGSGGSEAPCSHLGCPRKAAGKPRSASQVSAEKFSNGSSALSNIPNRSAVQAVKCPTVQSPMAMHPSFCLHHQFRACCWSHGCWQPPCLLSMRQSMPPQTACPRAGPVRFPPMPPPSIPKCNYVVPELHKPETLLPNFANGETPLHFASWQGKDKMDFQSFQESEIPGAEELEDGDDEPIFVLTDEYAEFFAKSEARRQEKKRQQRKEARNVCRAAKCESEKQDAESKNSPS